MIIQQAIEKAIKGGYKYSPFETYGQYKLAGIREEQTFLDPLFWQGLGKAMGWDSGELSKVFVNSEAVTPMWKHQWHEFVDHLAGGKDAESFFETL